uniref:OVA5 n=1 Tax=Arundo donax TaxID=35708 RepID=A0A0A9DX95_ARUDO
MIVQEFLALASQLSVEMAVLQHVQCIPRNLQCPLLIWVLTNLSTVFASKYRAGLSTIVHLDLSINQMGISTSKIRLRNVKSA